MTKSSLECFTGASLKADLLSVSSNSAQRKLISPFLRIKLVIFLILDRFKPHNPNKGKHMMILAAIIIFIVGLAGINHLQVKRHKKLLKDVLQTEEQILRNVDAALRALEATLVTAVAEPKKKPSGPRVRASWGLLD